MIKILIQIHRKSFCFFSIILDFMIIFLTRAFQLDKPVKERPFIMTLSLMYILRNCLLFFIEKGYMACFVFLNKYK